MATPFGSMSIGELQAGLAAKEFSAAEVARGTFERIEAADGVVHSFLETTEALALDAAARIDGAIAAEAKVERKGNVITTTYKYDGVEFHVDVEVDAVQTHNAQDAIKSAWGVDASALGIL